MRYRILATVLAACGLVTFLQGCGGHVDRPPMGKVKGKVTYNGQSVTSGTVTFTPITGKGGDSGNVASGPIEPDGSFTLTTFDTGDGAVLGQHAATVIVREGGGDLKSANVKPGADVSQAQMVRPRYTLPKLATPSKYADPRTTPLKYTVREGQNTFDLELKD